MRWNCWQIVESFLYKIRTRYPTQPVSFLLMSWRRKEPGHQHLRYWPGASGLFRSYHQSYCFCMLISIRGFTTLSLSVQWWCLMGDIMSPGGHCQDYYPGTLSYMQVSAIPVQIRRVSPTYTRSSSELQGLSLTIGLRYSSPSCGRQGDMPYSATLCSVLLYLWIKIYLKRTHW